MLFFLFYSLLSSCIEQYVKDSPEDPAPEGIRNMRVPDGFDFEMYQSQEVSVSFTGSTSGRVIGDLSLQFAIIGEDFAGEIHGFRSGHTLLENGINLQVSKPLHIAQLYSYTKYSGNARFFELNQESLSLDISDLLVDESVFGATSARLSSVPTCTSFLGNATKIHCRDNEIVIQSSASFQELSITFFDGVVNNYFPGEVGSLNANNNIWTLNSDIDGYALNEMNSFTVYADCMTSPKNVGLELITFANPCYYESVDSDGDGVDDYADVQPLDENISSVEYIPARNRYATFAFEDMWPFKGDYDFNDLVISHNATVFSNTDNFITKVDYNFVIRAIGAKFDNDLCISFTDPNGALLFDQIQPETLNYEIFYLDGVTEIRFARYKNLFETGGFINTDSTKAFVDPINVSLTLLFDGAVTNENFKVDEYLRINQETGREVHKPGQQFTSLMDVSMLGSAADDTSPDQNKYFKTKSNLPWVLEIPTEWEYPKERSEITLAYPRFKDFMQGNYQSPWYTDDAGNKVHKHLFKKR